jgi:hypothetical protein
MKRKPPTHKRARGGWKESPLKSLDATAKKRKRQWLADWSVRRHQLSHAASER